MSVDDIDGDKTIRPNAPEKMIPRPVVVIMLEVESIETLPLLLMSIALPVPLVKVVPVKVNPLVVFPEVS